MMHEEFSPELFKERTRKIIEQYDEKFSTLGNSFYDVIGAGNHIQKTGGTLTEEIM